MLTLRIERWFALLIQLFKLIQINQFLQNANESDYATTNM